MAYETVLYDVADRICTITLNRPEKLNAWTRQMHLDLKDAMHKAGADPDVRAIILTGAGRGFCAGADMGGLQAIGAGASASIAATQGRHDLPGGSTLAEFRMNYSYFPAIPKFIIAAINGPAAGLGFVIPLYADLRFAAESAVFTTAFAQRGLIAEHGVSWLLPRLVGLPAALDLLCSARKFRAPEALALGLVSRVIADDKLLAETRAYARLLADTVSPRSVAVMKRQIWEAEFQTLAEATVQANHEMDLSFQTADFKEGVAHFLEKRAARFTGRNAASSLDLLGLAGAGLPGHQAALDDADDGVEHQGEGGQHDDAGEHGVDVEGALGLQDQVADAARRAEILADHGADEGEAHGVVQAGEHPAHGRRQVDRAQQLARARRPACGRWRSGSG